ncbi:uncharacterized protein TRIADDRAFT_59940 [Trichoplax adhaerens]|uniref:Arrestin C-terminal-like domain-containing protein n=1 Tax=Trichoplax adhaerens TaxID=10228 RepID=B3S6V3_TRIAD|nr:hypothetical protein TRIADDRAFT_59940 [Trichoplax adhaerens]EDV21372.1 hypothetical protein TRIADDRAFT_59940 [Trichoplax adhaerens]|eukprot:XP_002115972.1 hypothetical protein TRIADDRAFT_59940 [Trichoplax adhaerens]
MSIKSKSLRRFTIRLAREESVFYPGETISGRVTIVLVSPINVSNVRLRFYGRARVSIAKAGQEESTYDEQLYVDKSAILFGKDKMTRSIRASKLSEGRYDFEFNFPLPSSGLPSSFEDGNGSSIRYIIDCWIEIPKKQTRIARKAVTILETIDTKLPQFSEPSIPIEIEKKFGCFCINSGMISFACKLARKCYCPGENVVLQLDIENGLPQNLTSIKVKLVRKLYMRAHGNSTMSRKEYISKDLLCHINYHDKYSSPINAFVMPCISPTNLISRLIQVEYLLEVNVNVNRRSTLAVVLPIIVGTILPNIMTIAETKLDTSGQPAIVICSPVTVTLPREYSFSNRTSLKHNTVERKISNSSGDTIKISLDDMKITKSEEVVNSNSNEEVVKSNEEEKEISSFVVGKHEPNIFANAEGETESNLASPMVGRSVVLKNKLSLKLNDADNTDSTEPSNFAPCIDGPISTVEEDDINCVFIGNTQFIPRYSYAWQPEV